LTKARARGVGLPAMEAAPCQPTFVPMAAMPDGALSHGVELPENLIARGVSALPISSEAAAPPPLTLAYRQRPPPTVSLAQSDPFRTPGLRAPPASPDFAG
jgi:hypothetical protein